MEKFLVHKLCGIGAVFALCGLLTGIASAGAYRLTNGQTVTGEVVTVSERGFVLKQDDGTYSDPVPWGKLSQEGLKDFLTNSKAVPFVEPFIEIPVSEKLKRTEVEIKEVPRLARPASGSLLAALTGSGAGIIMLLLIYAGNIYAVYEISIFRAQPVGLVCGVAAILPVLGPIIFMAMPTRLRYEEPAVAAPTEDGMQAVIAADQRTPTYHAGPPGSQTQGKATTSAAAAALPAGRVFPRGQYTFNRRFFETQMPAFFAIVRPEAEKNAVLTFKSTRGTHIAQRISRISASEIYIQVQKGHASEEIIIPFVEIQEVQLQH